MLKSKPSPYGPAGAELWESIAPQYDLRPDELRVLSDACHMADVVAMLREAFVADGRVMVKGSMGQEVLNPLIAEQRTHQSALSRLLAQLKLPNDAEGESGDVSSPARKAAAARWSRGA